MKLIRAEKKITLFFVFYAVLIFLLICSFIKFLININMNAGILPIIFILLTIIFLMDSFSMHQQKYGYSNGEYTMNFKFWTFLLSVFNALLFVLSFVVLWL